MVTLFNLRSFRLKNFHIFQISVLFVLLLGGNRKTWKIVNLKYNLFSLQQGPLTDDMVTIYRNYVILYSLRDVIKEVAICVYNL